MFPAAPTPDRPDPPATISRIVVAVPAFNEEALLPGCLRSIARAVRHVRMIRPELDVEVVVALDGCTDRSAAVAASFPFTCITAPHAGAAAARMAAVCAGLTSVATAGVALTHVWIASTDADSVVPECWLTDFVRLADIGVDLVAGAVEPIGPCDQGELAAWSRRHRPARGERLFHSANLGIRASTYVEVGGFAPLPAGEDVDLVTRVTRTPARSIATQGEPVRTCAPTPERLRRLTHA